MKATRFLLAALLAFTGCAGQSEFDAAAERDAAVIAHQPPPTVVTPQIADARSRLRDEFAALLANLYPAYNGIFVRVDVTVSGGVERNYLRADHALFGEYEFAAGPVGPSVKRWVEEREQQLRFARITSVNIGSCAAYPSWIFSQNRR